MQQLGILITNEYCHTLFYCHENYFCEKNIKHVHKIYCNINIIVSFYGISKVVWKLTDFQLNYFLWYLQ